METERSTLRFSSSSKGERTARYLTELRLWGLTGKQAIIVGAGIAGIAASILIPRKVANLTYKVFEKQDAVVSIES